MKFSYSLVPISRCRDEMWIRDVEFPSLSEPVGFSASPVRRQVIVATGVRREIRRINPIEPAVSPTALCVRRAAAYGDDLLSGLYYRSGLKSGFRSGPPQGGGITQKTGHCRGLSSVTQEPLECGKILWQSVFSTIGAFVIQFLKPFHT